jgi:hypothetical protein
VLNEAGEVLSEEVVPTTKRCADDERKVSRSGLPPWRVAGSQSKLIVVGSKCNNLIHL